MYSYVTIIILGANLKTLTGVRVSDEHTMSISTSADSGTNLTGESMTAEVLQENKQSSDDHATDEKILNFILQNCQKQTAPFGSTAQ